jgi:glycoside/pentoside/hexuronide:cation symporter, GPH family
MSSAALTWREKLSYGGGSVASNLSWNMVAGFLIVYYTDVALLPAAAVGTLVLVTRIVDAAFDPVVGVLVDRTRSRFGKVRPYLLFAPIPFAILCVLTFLVPDASQTTKLIYACVTFGLLGLAYSFLFVPYGALQPTLTHDPRAQLQLSGIRAMGTSVASIIVYALVLPTVAWFAARTGTNGYGGAATVFAIATAVLYWNVFVSCRERITVVQAAGSPASIGQSLRELMHNKIWIIAMLFEVLIFIRLGLMVPAMAFYAREVLHQPSLTSILLPLMSVSILTGGILAPWYLARMRKRRGVIVALCFSCVFFALMPFVSDSLPLLLGAFFLSMVSQGVQATTIFTMITEAVELQQRKFGTRSEGLISSSTAFTQKVGFAVGSSLVAYALALAGYNPKVPQESVGIALTWLVSAGPILVAMLQIACIAFYDVDDSAAGQATAEAPAAAQEVRA